MAILFSCPYCTASVKVPDSASGKLGVCPKCATKIRIPSVAIPPPNVRMAPSPAMPVAPPPPLRATPPQDLDPVLGDLMQIMPPAAPPPLPTNPLDPFDFSRAGSAPSIAASTTTRKKKLPRQPIGSGLLIAVGLGLLAIAGVGLWTYLQSLPVYEGAVAGNRVPSGQAIAVTVPWSSLEIPPQTQLPVIEYFKRHKTSLTNNLLKIEIGASTSGLVVRFETTEDSILVSVDPLLVPDVKTLISHNKTAWEESRKRELIQYAKDLCENVAQAQAAGTRLENVSHYRDFVALNSLVRGLGRHCVAVANKTTHSCVFEDEQGLLYFVVPNQVHEILVLEKAGEGRVKVLPVDFRIRASVPQAAASIPHLESTEPEDEPAAAEKPAASNTPQTPNPESETPPAASPLE